MSEKKEVEGKMGAAQDVKGVEAGEPADSLESLFELLPEGTRIIIDGNRVTFENMTGDMLDIALSLNPDDPDLKARKGLLPE